MPEITFTTAREPQRQPRATSVPEHEYLQARREEVRAANRERHGHQFPSPEEQRVALHASGHAPEPMRLSALSQRTGAAFGDAEAQALDALDAAVTARVAERPELRTLPVGSYATALEQLERERHPSVLALETARASRGVASARRTHAERAEGATVADEHEAGVEALAAALNLSAVEALDRYSRGERAGSTQPGTFTLSDSVAREQLAAIIAHEHGVTLAAGREAVAEFERRGVLSFDDGALRFVE